jgi:hypothetical protein
MIKNSILMLTGIMVTVVMIVSSCAGEELVQVKSGDTVRAYLTETYVNDHWELHLDFTEPLPKLDAQDATFITFVASTNEEIGENTYAGSGWVTYAAFGAEEAELFEGEYGPGTIGCYYNITATVGSYTVQVTVGITGEGEIVILSWQVQ